MSGHESDWISLVGTAAGVVGAAAAVFQIYQNRKPRTPRTRVRARIQRSRPVAETQANVYARKPLLSRSADGGLREDVDISFKLALVAVFTELVAVLCVLVNFDPLAYVPGFIGVPALGFSLFLAGISVPDIGREAFKRRIIGEMVIVLLVLAIDAATIAVPAIVA